MRFSVFSALDLSGFEVCPIVCPPPAEQCESWLLAYQRKSVKTQAREQHRSPLRLADFPSLTGFEPVGRGFESLRARQKPHRNQVGCPPN